jgi:hypothetical protein
VPVRATLPQWHVRKTTVQTLTLHGNTIRIMARRKMTDVAIMAGEERQRLNSGHCPQSTHHIKTAPVKTQTHRPSGYIILQCQVALDHFSAVCKEPTKEIKWKPLEIT